MLKEILSISGKPGLFKLISRSGSGKGIIIVEALADGKRMPAYPHEKVIALGDIFIFTESGETPLSGIFEKIKEKNNGAVMAVSKQTTDAELQKHFLEILPDYDKEKVHKSDIRKIFAWYNILIEKGLTDFSEPEEEKEEAPKEE